jgi:hypothetical protein
VKAPGVILLPAKYWRYKLPRTVDEVDNFNPPLSTLLNTLIDVWIDLPDNDISLREHVAIHIGYFYSYNQDIRKPDFENELAAENRRSILNCCGVTTGHMSPSRRRSVRSFIETLGIRFDWVDTSQGKLLEN